MTTPPKDPPTLVVAPPSPEPQATTPWRLWAERRRAVGGRLALLGLWLVAWEIGR